jgi:YesN/AraC family two-component response regulator
MHEWGVEVPDRELKAAYFDSKFLRPKEHDAVVRMLSIFAQHLSLVSNQVMVQQQNAETPVIARAKDYILEHQTDDLSLAQVARAVNTSTFYFCKIFKKSTGIYRGCASKRPRISCSIPICASVKSPTRWASSR